MKLKPKTYYKRYYKWENPDSDGDWYAIYYTGNKWVYKITRNFKGNEPIPLYKYNSKFKWRTIKSWQKRINNDKVKLKEITRADLFLELL